MTDKLQKIFAEIDAKQLRSGEIECFGDEMLQALAEARKRNLNIERIDAGVKTPAGYRLHWHRPAVKISQPDLLPV